MARHRGGFALILALAIAAAAVLASFPLHNWASTCGGGQPAHLAGECGRRPHPGGRGAARSVQLVLTGGHGLGVAESLLPDRRDRPAAAALPGEAEPHARPPKVLGQQTRLLEIPCPAARQPEQEMQGAAPLKPPGRGRSGAPRGPSRQDPAPASPPGQEPPPAPAFPSEELVPP